jgi:D-alanyl-D-alanine carboxypeptidase
VAIRKYEDAAQFVTAPKLGALLLALALAAAPLSQAAAKPKSQVRSPAIAASIVVDMNANRVLQAQNADTPRQPASLTKMMTLYMLFTYMRSGAIGLDSELVITPHAASQAPTKLNVKAGQSVRTADAISALVTLSANDVAVAVAENIAGTEGNFARMMTDKARSLGMKSTVFRNASGLPNPEQITTARDMAILAHHLIHDFPEYYSCFSTKVFTYRGRSYRNHNKLLFGYRGTDGIKTGYTRAAGFNLTASVHRDNKHVVAVVLGGRTGAQRDAAMRALLDANFPKASNKPASEPLVASRDSVTPAAAPAAAPAPKRKIFALASAAPAALSFGQGQSPASKPASSRQAAPAPIPDPVPLSEPAPVKKAAKGSRQKGPFHVQVGAYASQKEAEKRLGVVKSLASDLLDGYAPVTTVFEKDDTQWYRARFAGFSKDGADSTCGQLKRLALDCVVMRAN